MTLEHPTLNGRAVVNLARPGAGRLALGVLAGAAALGCAVGLTATSAWLISRAAQHPPVLYLAVAIVGVRAFGLGRGLFRYAERLVTHDAVFRALADLRVRVYAGLERLAPTGLPAFRRGDLLGRLVADVDDVQHLFLRGLVPPAIALVVGAGSVALAGALLPAAGVILGVGLAVGGVAVPWLTATLSRRAEHRTVTERAELTASVAELLRGAPELIACGAAAARLADLDATDRALRRAAGATARTAGVGAALTVLATGGAAIASLLVAVPAARAGQLPGVDVAVLALLPLAAFEAVAGLPLAAQQLQRTRRAAGRVLAIASAPSPVAEPARPAEVPPGPHTIEARSLSARWPGAQEPALSGVDLLLTPGRRVAVVGPSGAGKSTLAAVLLRFLDPECGSVTVNGTPMTSLDGDAARRIVGLCDQDAHLFDSTIGENIRLARRDATDVELAEAIERAHLAAWLEDLPDGLDTLVGEHGARVSGGQRQRIALARALLADFRVLVLDEPAANLDNATADALTADLLDATRGRTTVLITHRMAGLDAVDEIVVLDRGRVAQRGRHAELVGEPGPYRRMVLRERRHGFMPISPNYCSDTLTRIDA